MSTSPFVYYFCITQDAYLSIWLPHLHHTECLAVHLSATSASNRIDASPFVYHFCIKQDWCQSICLPLLHHTGCLAVHLSATSASNWIDNSLLVCHFCMTQDVYHSFVCDYCITQYVYHSTCLSLMHHTVCLPFHLSATVTVTVT